MAHHSSEERPAVDTSGTATRVVRFALGERAIALELSEIAGLSEPGTVRSVPGAAAAIVGIAGWRGRIVTIIDLRALLEAPPRRNPGPSSWLRLAAPREHLVLHVDGLVSLAPSSRTVETGRAAGSAGFVRPSVRDGESIELLDPQALVRALEAAQRHAADTTAGSTGAP